MFDKFFLKYPGAGFDFIKKHPDILYSLALIIVLPLVLYFNLNFAINSFQKNIDAALQTQAFTVEKLLDAFLIDYLGQKEILSGKIEKIAKENPEIVFLEISLKEGDEFKKIISYPLENGAKQAPFLDSSVQKQINESLKTGRSLSWQKDEAIGFLTAENEIRRWNVVRPFHNANGEKIGLIQLALSLEKIDNLFIQTIKRSYAILIIAVILVLFLIINHTKLFEYSVLFKKLRELDKMKDDFISMAAHELRTPIAVIKGYAQILKESLSSALNKEQAGSLTTIIKAADNLGNLIADILDVSKIEQGRLSFEFQKILPDEAIEETIEDLKPKAEEKKIEIVFNKTAGTSFISADPARFRQIITNLVGNAIKYTEEGKIEIILSPDKLRNKYSISVQDTGLGMSAEAQKKLFGKFYRVKTSKTEEIAGTGLGLWITKTLCEKMNAEIFLESMEGIGSKFTIIFPLAKESDN